MPRLRRATFDWRPNVDRSPHRLRSKYGIMALAVLLASVGTSWAVSVHAQPQQRLPDVTVTPLDNPPASPLLSNPGSGNGPAAPIPGQQQQTQQGQGPGGQGDKRCADSAASKDNSIGCLNAKLRRKVDEVNPPILNTPPIDAKSSDLKVGTVNIPGVQQQYGQNFGHSVVPYRPTVVTPSVLGRH